MIWPDKAIVCENSNLNHLNEAIGSTKSESVVYLYVVLKRRASADLSSTSGALTSLSRGKQVAFDQLEATRYSGVRKNRGDSTENHSNWSY